MLIRISGGESGIKDYLENGQKQGRDYSRDELDERVILDGDLNLTDTLINRIANEGDKYLHITLAFKEDEISRETLTAITQDFKAFSFTAFNDDEYSLYAEAHLPRIKSYTHAKTGELVERKPHIHIVIPKYNLLSGESLNPFGLVERQVKYLEALQETLNNRYGLASPKDNRRVLFTDDSEMLSRYKGDRFTRGSSDFKNALLSELLDKQIERYEDFKNLLARHGEVKIRNAGKPNEYLWVKIVEGKGINLRDAAFSREFIELPPLQKLQRLNKETRYETATTPRDNQAHYDKALQEWHTQRAKEIKYVYLGKRSEYETYQQATDEDKVRQLAEREKRYYARHIPKTIEIDAPLAVDSLDLNNPTYHGADQGQSGTTHSQTKTASRPESGTKTSVSGQLLHDKRSDLERTASNREFAVIKQQLQAKQLLIRLSHSHGVNPEKYAISQGQDGGDRIQAGTRKLNVSDFLTKELNLDYRTAGQILRAVYQEQSGQALEVTPRESARAELWQSYQAERQATAAIRKAERQIQQQLQQTTQKSQRQALKIAQQAQLKAIRANRRLSAAERQAAISLAKMQRIQAETSLREQARLEREQRSAVQRDEYRNGYRNWLTAQAQNGHQTALSELRRMQAKAKTGSGKQEIHSGTENPPQADPLLNRYRLSYQVHRDGAVTYQCDGIELVRDEGRFVKVLQTEDNSIETGLRLALAKFGNKLTVHGNDAFKASIARVAADKGLWVEFTDPQINQLMATRKAERQQGRAQTQTSNQPPTAKPPSVLNSTAANTELGRYTGQVVGIDQRYVFQAHEQQIIRHDRSLFSTAPAPGENVRISYRGGLLKAEPVKTRSRGR